MVPRQRQMRRRDQPVTHGRPDLPLAEPGRTRGAASAWGRDAGGPASRPALASARPGPSPWCWRCHAASDRAPRQRQSPACWHQRAPRHAGLHRARSRWRAAFGRWFLRRFSNQRAGIRHPSSHRPRHLRPGTDERRRAGHPGRPRDGRVTQVRTLSTLSTLSAVCTLSANAGLARGLLEAPAHGSPRSSLARTLGD